jgi:hypothetical protein
MKTFRNRARTAKTLVGVVVVALAAVSLSACSGGGSSPSALSAKHFVRQQNRESAVKPSVAASDQTTNGFSVTVAKAIYPKNAVGETSANEGVVTVAPLVNGRPGDIAGFTTVPHGTSTNVKVPVQVQLRSGSYRVALYPGGTSPSGTQHALTGTDVTIIVASG